MSLGDPDPVAMTLDRQCHVQQVRLHAEECLRRQLYPVQDRPAMTPRHLGDRDREQMTSTLISLPGVAAPSAGIAICLQDAMLGTVPHGRDPLYQAMDTEREIVILRAAATPGLLAAHRSGVRAEAGHPSGTSVVATGTEMMTEAAPEEEDSPHRSSHIQPSRLHPLASAVLALSAGG
jgi:hypothetical protein